MYKIVNEKTMEISGRKISFPCNIMKDPDGNPFILEEKGLVIVNFYGSGMDTISNKRMERNIEAFDRNGNLVWAVSPPTFRPYDCNPYTAVFRKDGKIYGGNWCGHDFEINLKDGTVTPPQNPGRPW